MIYEFCRYFFIFMIYSIGGWVLETVTFAVRDGDFVKRGFLFGPVCPIYGTAAVVLSLLFYGKIENIFLLFIACFFICGAIEYVTHFLMEKLFHAMWWDYSGRRFNLKGRVYLMGLVGFGAGGVIILKVIHPLVVKLTDALSPTALYIICFVLYSIALVDIALTIADLTKVIKGIKGTQNFIFTHLQKGLDNTKKGIRESKPVRKMKESANSENSLIKKIQKKHPNFNKENFRRIFNIVFDEPQEGKARTDIKLYGTTESLPSADDEEDK